MMSVRRFYDRTFKPFFLFTGAGTALIGLYAVMPEWAVVNLAKLDFAPEYTIIVQHWGIMVCLMGIFMMATAFAPALRIPILTYSGIEKAFMVWLVLSNASQPYTGGFWIPFSLDLIIVLYTIGYFLSRMFHRDHSS